MATASDLRRAIDALEGVQADLARIASRSDPERFREMIDLRRLLAARIAEAGALADAFFAEAGDADLRAECRKAFSQMRSAAALHQASWPAVRLKDADDSYRDSALGVRAANRRFAATVREALDRIERGEA